MGDEIDRLSFGGVFCGQVRCVAGEGAVGYLQRVEHHTGATEVDVVGGDGVEDLSGGETNGGAVLEHGEIEQAGGAEFCRLARSALTSVVDGDAGGVVVVAEVFSSETGAAAAPALSEDVAALEAGLEEGVVFGGSRCAFGKLFQEVVVGARDGHHVVSPSPMIWGKILRTCELVVYQGFCDGAE
ncbi:hypothetical protein HDF16_004691 [Granulicella aggregans]|uniref:Uncharacterized protein n=1 Tax=Granulicella aggregans TaxID=474949 RepID=A0A7W8E5S8_9BACT|nr:hypothetical protein [Granulicella aggregans]MBB5059957.1 hypothetical protein [Granulicella aggregans]